MNGMRADHLAIVETLLAAIEPQTGAGYPDSPVSSLYNA
jgi:hypothetical protein